MNIEFMVTKGESGRRAYLMYLIYIYKIIYMIIYICTMNKCTCIYANELIYKIEIDPWT